MDFRWKWEVNRVHLTPKMVFKRSELRSNFKIQTIHSMESCDELCIHIDVRKMCAVYTCCKNNAIKTQIENSNIFIRATNCFCRLSVGILFINFSGKQFPFPTVYQSMFKMEELTRFERRTQHFSHSHLQSWKIVYFYSWKSAYLGNERPDRMPPKIQC